MQPKLMPSRIDLDMEITDKLVRQLAASWAANARSEWMAAIQNYAAMRQCEIGTALLGRLEAIEELLNEIAGVMSADLIDEEDNGLSIEEALEEALVTVLQMKKERR